MWFGPEVGCVRSIGGVARILSDIDNYGGERRAVRDPQEAARNRSDGNLSHRKCASAGAETKVLIEVLSQLRALLPSLADALSEDNPDFPEL